MTLLTREQREELHELYADGADVNHLFDKAFTFGIEWGEVNRIKLSQAALERNAGLNTIDDDIPTVEGQASDEEEVYE